MPYGWDPLPAWARLTDQTKFNPDTAYSRWFKDPCIIALHFYLSGALFEKPEFDKVSTEELYVIDRILDNKPIDVSQIMMNAIMDCATKLDKFSFGVRTMANLLCQVARMPHACEVFTGEDTIPQLSSSILYHYGYMNYIISESRIGYRWKSWEDRVAEDLRREREEAAMRGRTRAGLRKKLEELLECHNGIQKELDTINGRIYDMSIDLGELNFKVESILDELCLESGTN